MAFAFLGQIAALSGLLVPAALPVKCVMNQAPVINIRPKTEPIQYDYSKTTAQLTQMKSNTISPYGLTLDQATGGLRHDRPNMRLEIEFNGAIHDQSGSTCMSYKEITLTIELKPTIYIAKEFNTGKCGREVLEHEKKHVRVDREIINKYARQMGEAVQNAVNAAGAIGPFNRQNTEQTKQTMYKHIESAVSSTHLMMANEMNMRQQQVDSLEEYEKISKHCKDVAKKIFKSKK